jgi:hypothetical protein
VSVLASCSTSASMGLRLGNGEKQGRCIMAARDRHCF